MSPEPADPRLDRLLSAPFAHRGLWSVAGPPENSLAAFEAACEAGYGVELDVRLSADGEAMVFHDAHLARMAGAAARLEEKTAAELAALRLKSSREGIPTLGQALAVVANRSAVLIEIKSDPGEEGPLDQRVAEILDKASALTAIIGFNPRSQAWWRTRRPEVLRGFNAEAPGASQMIHQREARIAAALVHAPATEPHFLALCADMVPSATAAGFRAKGRPIVCWTIRSWEDQARVQQSCDAIIFEGFEP